MKVLGQNLRNRRNYTTVCQGDGSVGVKYWKVSIITEISTVSVITVRDPTSVARLKSLNNKRD